MVLYTLSFLGLMLAGLPYAFYLLGELVYPIAEHPWLQQGPIQDCIGAILVVGALCGYLFCSLWLVVIGKGPFVEFDPPKEFVATGPYRWSRNPIASWLIVAVLGEAIYFGSPGIFLFFLLGFPIAQLQVTRLEEPLLRKRFGDAYVEYCRRVPRWFPRWPKAES